MHNLRRESYPIPFRNARVKGFGPYIIGDRFVVQGEWNYESTGKKKKQELNDSKWEGSAEAPDLTTRTRLLQ